MKIEGFSFLFTGTCSRNHERKGLKATSFPGSLFSASLGRWKKDPGCGWSRYHPESGWQKYLLGGRGGRVFCLVDVTDFGISSPLAVAKNYSL